jgi:radical SAM superfamily enzyme YgiQ (UPF0313 family)
MEVVLLSTYDLGHQPFGLASPAAWLRQAGASVTCQDLAVENLDEQAIRCADLIAIYLPMHTATRLASVVAPRLTSLNPRAHVCFYGLYAPLNEAFLRGLGAGTILGGEFESGLLSLYALLSSDGKAPAPAQSEPVISMAKQTFRVPDRRGLPPLSDYAYLTAPDGRRHTVGYTEASRGCKHLCRHCPVVPVYDGQFRIIQADVILEDVRQQVAEGAEHITFGDPDFFNGAGHAVRVVRALHDEFPDVTYDVTIKVEHLLKHGRHLPVLAETGCLFVTTAVESIDDGVLLLLDKGHTRDDFIRAVGLARQANLTLSPTFIPFTPWASPEGYLELLHLLARLDLIPYVSPVQLVIRLLVPEGSRLLDVAEMRTFLGDFDATALSYAWTHPDPRVDRLQETVAGLVEGADGVNRRDIFESIWHAAHEAIGVTPNDLAIVAGPARADQIPQLSEAWYCCAEPTSDQLAKV